MIEVLIVVLILGITTAVVMPLVGNRSDMKLAAAARTLMADMQYGQNLAIATRTPIYIRFDTNAYSLCTKAGTTLSTIIHPVTKMTFSAQFGATASSSVLSGVTLTKPSFGGDAVIVFDSLGVPSSYNEASALKTSLVAQAQITLTCGGQQQVICIEPYTGEISVP